MCACDSSKLLEPGVTAICITWSAALYTHLSPMVFLVLKMYMHARTVHVCVHLQMPQSELYSVNSALLTSLVYNLDSLCEPVTEPRRCLELHTHVQRLAA